jgi:hypothetical protein
MFFQIVEKANINIVTCGDCGLVVFHQIEREGDICCPHCSLESDSRIPKGKGYIPFGLNKLSSSLPLSCIIARLIQVVKVQR